MTMKNREIRTVTVAGLEVRADADKPPTIRGHAAMFNSETDIAGLFAEQIAPGAFARAIDEGQDVRALFNHDESVVMARTTNGTLRLTEDKQGLRVDFDPNMDSQAVSDVVSSIERGDVSQMSFAFRATKETWEERDDKLDLRTVQDVDLFDVSAVTYPAYDDTTVAVRMQGEWRDAEKEHADAVDAAKAAGARAHQDQKQRQAESKLG